MAGVLGSLVSITAICGVVRPAESLAIGFIGAAITIFGWQLLDRLKIDDPVGAVSTHAGGSVWAMIAVGLFVEKDSLPQPFSKTYGAFKGGHVKILGVQLLACVSITVWTIFIVFIQLYAIDKCVGLRLTLEEEILGADVCEHGIKAQQPSMDTCLVTALPVSPNRVIPLATDKQQENLLIVAGDFNSRAAIEGNSENRLENAVLERYETVTGAKSDGMPQDTKHTNRVSNNEAYTVIAGRKSKDNDSRGVVSTALARNSWCGAVSPNNTGSEKHKRAAESPPLHSSKSTVLISLTPVDDDQAVRLSVSDLHKQ